MPSATPGIHHVTAIASDPVENYDFYTDVLGLRLVKRSVNQDDVSVYHLFYADHEGSPGTSMTFFPYTNAQTGQVGTGQVSQVSFLIPSDAIEYWIDRLTGGGVDIDGPKERFGEQVIEFEDPDGLPLALVGREDVPRSNLPESPVPEAHVIRGFHGVTLSLASADPTIRLLETMGYDRVTTDHGRTRLEAAGDRERGGEPGTDRDLGTVVDVIEDPQSPRGRPGAGTVHHVAYQVEADEQGSWREVLQGQGVRPTEIIDRKWFHSVYAREHGGVLFEFATKEPGYTVDEPLETLGSELVLPEWLEDRREEIEAGLPSLDTE